MKIKSCVIIILLWLFASHTHANELAAYESYLNNIKTYTADFTEIGESGEIRTGIFYLSRPGKFRWQYNPPTPFIIVANGAILTYYDSELKQKSFVSLNDNLAGFLTRKQISFSGDVKVLEVSKISKLTKITIVKLVNNSSERISLIFSEEPVMLRQLEVTDANQHLTTVNFYNVKNNQILHNDLFMIKK